jgi:DNA-binding response OmpR family regulator
VPIQVFALALPPVDPAVHRIDSSGALVEFFPEPAALLASIRRQAPDIVLLHHRSGDRLVLETVKRIRAMSAVPCLLRCVRGDDAGLRVAALEAGADDCLSASVTQPELLARMRAVLRRSAPTQAEHEGWRLSIDKRDLFTPSGLPCQLTGAEFDLLRSLMQGGRTMTRDELSVRVFRRPYTAADRAVDNLVARLRRKLERDPTMPVIKAVRGVGYAFVGFPPEPLMPAAQGACEKCRKVYLNSRL